MTPRDQVSRGFNTSSAERKRGAEQLVDFLTRTLSVEELCDNNIVERLSEIPYTDFLKLLERINGIIRRVPTAKRDILTPTGAAREVGIFSNFVFPPVEERQQLMEETFHGMKKIMVSDTPDRSQIVARTLFTSMIYLHPAADGNGRTGRALYFLTSPHVQKNPETFKDRLTSLLTYRSYGIDESHATICAAVYYDMIQARGIQHSIPVGTDVDAVLPVRPEAIRYKLPALYDPCSFGFDAENLRFIAAYDSMSPLQRQRYQRPSRYYFEWPELPRAVRKQATTKVPEVRTELVQRILTASLDPNQDWKRFGIELLDKACSYQK